LQNHICNHTGSTFKKKKKSTSKGGLRVDARRPGKREVQAFRIKARRSGG